MVKSICLPIIFQEIRKTNRRRRITLHTSAQTSAFLSTQNIDLMCHPLYSPDLAPNDFFLLPYVKNKMRSQRFSTTEEAFDSFRMPVLKIPQSKWQKCKCLTDGLFLILFNHFCLPVYVVCLTA